MLYHILTYNPQTKIAVGVEASRYSDDLSKCEHLNVGLISNETVLPNRTYSFTPCHKWCDNLYIKGYR